MKGESVTIAVFTGTGNTLMMANLFADELRAAGKKVSLVSMDSPDRFALPEDSALGLALPVACFSTYPTVWRFLDALPEGRGREAFLLATMGGVAFGMDGPLRDVVTRKGYEPIGSQVVVMPGNYNNKTMPVAENEQKISAASQAVKRYAHALLNAENGAAWRGSGLLPTFFAWLGHTRKPWRMFYKIFPLTVDAQKCIGCGICRDLCPEANIDMANGKAVIQDHCQSCQRCCGFCPVQAISVPGKPAVQYRSVTLEDLRALEGTGRR